MGGKISNFLAAIWSDWWARMTGLASLAVPAVAYFVGASGKELWWIVAYVFLLISAFRIWEVEYRHPGPHVVFVYETQNQKQPKAMSPGEYERWSAAGGGGKIEPQIPVILENTSNIAAFNAKIADIEMLVKSGDGCAAATATFPTVQMVKKEHPVEIQATIEQFGPLFVHDFGEFLKAAWNAKGSLTEPLKVPVKVSYCDERGKKYETRWEVVYDFYVVSTLAVNNGFRRISRRI